MIKTLFTRKTFIAISLSVMYAVLLVFTCACIDGAHTFFPKKNLVNMLAVGMRFEEIAGGTAGFVMVMLLAVFVTIAAVAICFERQFAVFKNIQPGKRKNVFMVYGYSRCVHSFIAYVRHAYAKSAYERKHRQSHEIPRAGCFAYYGYLYRFVCGYRRAGNACGKLFTCG